MDDPIYQSVKQVIATAETWTIGQLQRKFKIGYNRAAVITESLISDKLLENDADGHGRRKTLPIIN